MNRQRLELQIDVLRRVADLDLLFNMREWINRAETPCRTACCAFGHAALDPRMQAEGLSMNVSYQDDFNPQRWIPVTTVEQYNALVKTAFKEHGAISAYPLYTPPDGKPLDAFDAAAAFFDITANAASYLFDPEWYRDPHSITPEQVIAHVERVIELDGDSPMQQRYADEYRDDDTDDEDRDDDDDDC